jgi:preprotein translocase subunit SecD
MKNKRSLWTSLIIVVLIAVISLGAVLAAGWSPKLGLDLDGGLSVVYKTKRPVSTDNLNTVVNIMNERVDALGATGATVAAQGSNEIAVQIPGAKNIQQILDTIGNTAQLYFRPALCYAEPFAVSKGEAPSTGPVPASCASASQLTATNIDITQAPSANPPYNSKLSSINPDPQFTTYPSTTPDDDQAKDTVILPNADPSTNGTGRYVLGPSQVSGTAVHSASASLVSGQWVVNLTLTSAGSTAWDELAEQQFHAIIAIDLDAQVISAPLTQPTNTSFQSFDGQVQISGNFTEAEAKNLALQLNYGSLPVGLTQLTVQTVSPSLGKSSLQAGLISGLAGLILVLLYMIFYYRLLGIVVVSGLAVTGAILWALISLLGQYGTTIDLAGIIGIIVSIGITVDSYIVYFERLKDEARAGRTVRSSVDKGFASAFRTVLAADAVSFMGAAILYLISIGPVKGFALFLGMSTVLDVFVTYFFTRPFVILLGRSKAATGAKYLGVARGLGVDSAGAR